MDCSNFWKLDKIDKIGICFILFAFVIHSCIVCFAVENVEPSFSPSCGFSVGDSEFSERNASTRYFFIEPGYLYHISNGATFNENIGFSNEVPAVGLPVYDTFRIGSGETYDFTYAEHSFLVVCSYDGYNVTLTREPLEGMENVVDHLSYYAGFNIFDSFTDSLGFVLPVVLTCFGIWIVSVFIRRFSKGV